MAKPKVIILSPARAAASGVATHANMLFASPLADDFELLHFQVGSEGRTESWLQRWARLVSSPVALALLILHTRSAVVHLNTSINNKAYWRDLIYLMVANALGCKVVNQIHGGVMPAQFVRGMPLKRQVFGYFITRSDAVVLISKQAYQAYAEFSPDLRLAYIPNAIEHRGLMGVIAKAEQQKPLRLIYVGRLTYEKGLFEALDAFKQLIKQGRRLSFQIVGGGEAESDLQQHAEQLEITAQVHFLGPIFGEAKNALWKQADVFVFPTYSEGLPYSMLEAMAAGTPPITCPVGAIPDVLEHGVHGLLIPTRDVEALARAIAQLDDQRDQLYRMAVASRSCVLEHYTAERLAQDFHILYRSLIAGDNYGTTRVEHG